MRIAPPPQRPSRLQGKLQYLHLRRCSSPTCLRPRPRPLPHRHRSPHNNARHSRVRKRRLFQPHLSRAPRRLHHRPRPTPAIPCRGTRRYRRTRRCPTTRPTLRTLARTTRGEATTRVRRLWHPHRGPRHLRQHPRRNPNRNPCRPRNPRRLLRRQSLRPQRPLLRLPFRRLPLHRSPLRPSQHPCLSRSETEPCG